MFNMHKPSPNIIALYKKCVRAESVDDVGSAYKSISKSLISENTTDWDSILCELENILDYKFKDINYLKEALIHRSYYHVH
jgi:hypothetical protein